MNGKVMICLVAMVCCLQVGCADKPKAKETNNFNGLQPTSSIMLADEEVAKTSAKTTPKTTPKASPTPTPKPMMTLYFADAKGEKLVAEKRTVDIKDKNNLTDFANLAIQALFKGPTTANLVSAMPVGAPLPTVKVNQGTATVDFSAEFVKKHSGGSTGETMTVYSIVNTLCSIEGISQVVFTVDGKIVESFKGHLEFNKPFKMDKTLIQPQ